MDKNKFSQLLVSLRKEKNLYQQNIADIFQVTVQAVSKCENGESIPDIETLKRISEFYKISINDLLDGNKIYMQDEIKTKDEIKNTKKTGNKIKSFFGTINMYSFVESCVLLVLIFIIGFVRFYYIKSTSNNTSSFFSSLTGNNSTITYYIYNNYYQLFANCTGFKLLSVIISLILFVALIVFGFLKSIYFKKIYYILEIVLGVVLLIDLIFIGIWLNTTSSGSALGYTLFLIIVTIHLLLILFIKKFKLNKNS